MDMLPKATCWQDMLAQLITDVPERERLAAVLSIQPITLVRWASKASRPREKNIRNLLRALSPTHFQVFLELACVDFPNLTTSETQSRREYSALPNEFYEQLLRAYTKLPQPLGSQTLQELFLQQIIEHLDPERQGMAISLATCVRPLEGQVVRSLREICGIGTHPWKRDLEQKTMLLGAESLAGYALQNFRFIVVPSRVTPSLVPVRWTKHEQSAVAIPIARHAELCGCLIASSAIPNYFQEGKTSVLLLENYAMLATLLFEHNDFYAAKDIQLCLMPDCETQLPYFQQVNRRIQQQFRLAQVKGVYCSLEQARHQVWREIEEELIQAFLKAKTTPQQ